MNNIQFQKKKHFNEYLNLLRDFKLHNITQIKDGTRIIFFLLTNYRTKSDMQYDIRSLLRKPCCCFLLHQIAGVLEVTIVIDCGIVSKQMA